MPKVIITWEWEEAFSKFGFVDSVFTDEWEEPYDH